MYNGPLRGAASVGPPCAAAPMIEQDVPLSPAADLAAVAARIEAECADLGLRLTLKSSLAKYPGCTHWHYKQGRQPGTLEITLWPAADRLWFPQRAGRTAPWVAAIARLTRAVSE